MADQRSAFRFRLPWLPPQPPPRPAIAPRPVAPAVIPPPLPPRETLVPTPTNPSPPPQPALETQIPSRTPTQAPPQTEETNVPTQIPTPPPPQSGETQTPASAMSAPPTQKEETIAPAQPPITAISTPVTPPIAETQGPTVTPRTTVPQTVESRNTTQPPAISSANPSAGTPVIPLEQAPPQAPLPPKVTRSESQPLSPSRATTQSQVPSQPPSPSRAAAPPRIPSQPPSPSRAAAPTRVLSQPPSPSRATVQPRVPSQPSSPSRSAAPPGVPSQPSSPSRVNTQPEVSLQPASPSQATARAGINSQLPTTQSQTSPKPPTSTRALSSPSRAVPLPRAITPPSTPSRTASQPPSTPQTASQPQSTSLLTSGSAGQTSSPQSSSSPPDQHKPISETITESTSPNQPKLSQERLQPSYTSRENSPSPSDTEQLNLKERQQKSIKLELKAQDGLNDSMNHTSRQPPDESNPPKGWSDTPDQTDKRGTSNVESQSKHFPEDLKPEETKEVKEVLKEINDKTYGKAGHEDVTVPVSDIQAKEQTSITFQSTQTHESVGGKKVNPTSPSNGKETKNTAQPRNKIMVGTTDPHPKQVTSNTTHIPRHKEIRDDISNLVHKISTGDPKNSTNDKPVSVITLAGENRGASMQLGSDSSKQRGAIHIRRGYKIKPDENDGTTTNEEGSFKDKLKDTKGREDQAREAYVNSNIQGINNSIMFESSISERNPGVHIIHSHFPKEANKATRRQDFHDKQNGESNMVHAQKLTHHPMVKRRCLRGLFLESSESDSDDSSKPRRHGCRVGCSKDNKNSVL